MNSVSIIEYLDVFKNAFSGFIMGFIFFMINKCGLIEIDVASESKKSPLSLILSYSRPLSNGWKFEISIANNRQVETSNFLLHLDIGYK